MDVNERSAFQLIKQYAELTKPYKYTKKSFVGVPEKKLILLCCKNLR